MPGSIRYSVGDRASDSLTSADPSLGRVISRVGLVEILPGTTRFATLVRTVLGQQLSESAASAIIARVERAIGMTPEAIVGASSQVMRDAGVSGRKSEYLCGIARAVLSRELDLDALDTLDDEHVVERLMRVRGVGRWTAQMFLLFALQRPDVIILDDMGIRAAAGRALGLGRSASARELAEAAERWRPYRSAATLYLYFDRSKTKGAEVSRVAYTKQNVEKCWCGSCPVQVDSKCAHQLYEAAKGRDKLPPPDQLGGLYCSTGTAVCEDLNFVNLCDCPACQVWGENQLAGNHYCEHGSVE